MFLIVFLNFIFLKFNLLFSHYKKVKHVKNDEKIKSPNMTNKSSKCHFLQFSLKLKWYKRKINNIPLKL